MNRVWPPKEGGYMRLILQGLTTLAVLAILVPSNSYAQEREWQLDAQGEDSYLVFGVPNTADIGMSLWCKLGQKTVSIFAPLPNTVAATDAKVSLKIDAQEFPLQPKFTNKTFEAELKPSDEIMTAIASTERIGLVIADHVTVFPTEGANFFEFSRLCNTPQTPVEN